MCCGIILVWGPRFAAGGRCQPAESWASTRISRPVPDRISPPLRSPLPRPFSCRNCWPPCPPFLLRLGPASLKGFGNVLSLANLIGRFDVSPKPKSALVSEHLCPSYPSRWWKAETGFSRIRRAAGLFTKEMQSDGARAGAGTMGGFARLIAGARRQNRDRHPQFIISFFFFQPSYFPLRSNYALISG